MSGWQTMQRFERVREQAALLGLRLAAPKHHYNECDFLSLMPLDDALPIYSRDAELFVGTVNEAQQWLTGWARALQYMGMVGAADEKRIKKCEARYVEVLQRRKIEAEKKEIVKRLKASEKSAVTA